MLGEGATISEISDALQSYNHNFEKLALHFHKVDFNLNTLS